MPEPTSSHSPMSEAIMQAKVGLNEAIQRDPWRHDGFRAVPCMNVESVWVEIGLPEGDRPIEMAPARVRALAEFLTRVADTAEAWKGTK